MTHVIQARNVNAALAQGIRLLVEEGIREESRVGSVLVAPGPVITEYEKPRERVLFSPMRNANPFFHLMESLWMLAGQRNVDFPTYFNSKFKEMVSDDGKVDHGAYGHRWRRWFGMDQLELIVQELRTKPNSRRAVLTMWAPQGDLTPIGYSGGLGSKDVPCNTHAYFGLREGKLDMTVCCRSNDIWWGAYGANAVHFSVLQEYMAVALGAKIGIYRQFSNNYHLYTNVVDITKAEELYYDCMDHELYSQRIVEPYLLIHTDVKAWQEDLAVFMKDPIGDEKYFDPFFEDVAAPMYAAWYDRKNGGDGLHAAGQIKARDWSLACTEWIQRAEQRKAEKANG